MIWRINHLDAIMFRYINLKNGYKIDSKTNAICLFMLMRLSKNCKYLLFVML